MKTDRTSFSYLKWFGAPVIVFVAAAGLLTSVFEPISGDLTRIGRWAERDYGWSKPQPTVLVRANGAAIVDPQVLVLGDSFSHPNIWQSYLAEARHLDILSFQYQDVGCVDNWLHWVTQKHFPNARTVVIETVERGFVPLFRNLNKCTSRTPRPFELEEKNITPARPRQGLLLDARYLISTAINTLRAGFTEGRMVSGEVINEPLSSDKLFSNRKSNRLLYFAEDELKLRWSENDRAAAIENLERIQTDLEKAGLRLVVVVVPDKSTAYRRYLVNEASKTGYPDIFKQLASASVADVDLFGKFQQATENVVDLYLPNDTHLSTQGYKIMASQVADDAF